MFLNYFGFQVGLIEAWNHCEYYLEGDFDSLGDLIIFLMKV